MIINRVWAMPSKWTFTIKPIKELLEKYVGEGKDWIDPFAGNNSPAEVTNDLNPKRNAQQSKDVFEFLKNDKKIYSGILLDPPYSPRQVSEHYKEVGLKPSQWETSSGWVSKVKDLAASKVKKGGLAITFGWNSGGLGKNRGFEIIEILLVPHGGMHNDTIVVVERKVD